MTLEVIAQFATALSVVIAVLTVLLAIRVYRRQMNAQLFVGYTGRYEQIMGSFPKDGWSARLNLVDKLPERSDELSLCVLKYLNLCSEEFYLHKRKYLADEVWKIWEREIKRTLATPLFVREWKNLKGEFESYPEFQQFVEAARVDVLGSEAPRATPD
jgi:hypothetical protein